MRIADCPAIHEEVFQKINDLNDSFLNRMVAVFIPIVYEMVSGEELHKCDDSFTSWASLNI